jgi:hypothetical protein
MFLGLDISIAQRHEETFPIMLEDEHYRGQVMVLASLRLVLVHITCQALLTHCLSYDHPKDVEYLNKPIMNYT